MRPLTNNASIKSKAISPQAAPSFTLQKKGNSYQQQPDYSGNQQAEVKQDKDFQKQGNDERQTNDASSYQKEQAMQQQVAYPQHDSDRQNISKQEQQP